MNEVQVFARDDFGEIRVVEKDAEPWFVAADVCRALEIDATATRRLDDDEKNTLRLTQGTSGNPNVTIVNEPGLYALVLGSRKPEAKGFKQWSTHEVIPAIRRHGGYLTAETVEEALLNPDTLIRLAQNLKEEREARLRAETRTQALEEQAEKDAPKVLFADSVSASRQSILVGELAKLLRQNGVQIGQNRLFTWMRTEGFLGARGEQRNMPTQRSMDMGLFEIKETTITNADGSVRLTRTPKVTGKGQLYFVNRFLASMAPQGARAL